MSMNFISFPPNTAIDFRLLQSAIALIGKMKNPPHIFEHRNKNPFRACRLYQYLIQLTNVAKPFNCSINVSIKLLEIAMIYDKIKWLIYSILDFAILFLLSLSKTNRPLHFNFI
jgi:hypothetical protein